SSSLLAFIPLIFITNKYKRNEGSDFKMKLYVLFLLISRQIFSIKKEFSNNKRNFLLAVI
ncbi:hypothetical protein, partial [Priestia megaterium]|uniref:hypothetical protein n=1 Tax=Priestia megaterium TaxID=1404 RepID=UPI003009BA55